MDHIFIPIREAKDICDKYGKGMAFVLAFDERDEKLDMVTYAKNEEDRKAAKAIGENIMAFVGGDLSRSEHYQDLILRDPAKEKAYLEGVRACLDEFLKGGANGCQDYARLNEIVNETGRRLAPFSRV